MGQQVSWVHSAVYLLCVCSVSSLLGCHLIYDLDKYLIGGPKEDTSVAAVEDAALDTSPALTQAASREVCSVEGWCWPNRTSQEIIPEQMWGSAAYNLWTLNDSHMLFHWNGVVWQAYNSGTIQRLTYLWGSDANNVWAVGYGSTMVKWNGSAWSAQTSGTTNPLLGVSGPAHLKWLDLWASRCCGSRASRDTPHSILPYAVSS